MKTIETDDMLRVVYDVETQVELLQASFDWVDEYNLLDLYKVRTVDDVGFSSFDVRMETPDRMLDVAEYVPLIAGAVQKARHHSGDEIIGDEELTYRMRNLDDGTEVFGFVDVFGKASYPSWRRMSVVPSIALMMSHSEGNGVLKVQNRPSGERAWIDFDMRKGVTPSMSKLSGLSIMSVSVNNAIKAAEEAAKTVMDLAQPVRSKIAGRVPADQQR